MLGQQLGVRVAKNKVLQFLYKIVRNTSHSTRIYFVMDSPTNRELETWHTYLAATTRMMERLDGELQQHSHISLTDYEILDTLVLIDSKKIRMSELANKVLVSRSRLTYRVDRLVQIGYLERQECEDDRRGLWAILTQAGLEAHQKAQPGHEKDIKNWFFDNLNETELVVLDRVMSRIKDKLESNR